MSAHDLFDLMEPFDGDEFSSKAVLDVLLAFFDELGPVAHELPRLVGFVRCGPVTYFPNGRFDINVRGSDGPLSFIVGGYEPGERTVDGVAWPVGQPERWAVYTGRLPVLGLQRLLAHPEHEGATSLRVHRDPAAWLRAGGNGIVVLDREAGAREMRASVEAGGKFKFDDDHHASQAAAAMAALTDWRHLVVEEARAA